MANSYAANVQKVDTTATFSTTQFIRSIKYIGASSGTAVITQVGSSSRLWEESGASNVYNQDVKIKAPTGVTVTVSNSAVVYLYLE